MRDNSACESRWQKRVSWTYVPSGRRSGVFRSAIIYPVIRHLKAALLAIALASVAFMAAKASGADPQQKSDPAKSLARLLEDHYRKPRTFQAVFLERYSESQKEARVESGTVYFRRPGQMRWEYESPEKKLFLVDGKTTWFYVPYDRTVTKAPVKESSDWRTPLALLTGKADLSRLCAKIDLVAQQGIPDAHQVLRCIPKQAESPGDAGDFTEVLLEVDASSGDLARIQIRQPGGVQLEYRFGSWRADVPLDASLFRFQVPKGVAIVDAMAVSESSK
jgi:outer membrane lipoprotein carrier protein